jgi:hypothetical protein
MTVGFVIDGVAVAHLLPEVRDRGLQVRALTGVFGRSRDVLIARSKVVINVHQLDGQAFEIVRVSRIPLTSAAWSRASCSRTIANLSIAAWSSAPTNALADSSASVRAVLRRVIAVVVAGHLIQLVL